MISSSRRIFKKKKRKSFAIKNHLSNVIIGILSIIVIGFVWSFVDNLTNDERIRIDRTDSLEKLLVINEYEKNIGHRIRVEVLNGCGVQGIADKYTNLLRNKGFDVILSGNANNFKYSKTEVILRRDNINLAMEIATVLDVSTDKISANFNDLLDCDVTVILGSDFENLSSFNEALKYSPPF